MVEIYEPIYDAIQCGELYDSEYLFVRHDDDMSILIAIYQPSLIHRLFLWLRGYRFIIKGSEAIRLYDESYDANSFCQALRDF